jgi:sulfofructose kinase
MRREKINELLLMGIDVGTTGAEALLIDAVDATGAGDVFAAGFITGVWKRWSLEWTARFANAVGALCVTGLGATGGVRSLPKTLACMESARTI